MSLHRPLLYCQLYNSHAYTQNMYGVRKGDGRSICPGIRSRLPSQLLQMHGKYLICLHPHSAPHPPSGLWHRSRFEVLPHRWSRWQTTPAMRTRLFPSTQLDLCQVWTGTPGELYYCLQYVTYVLPFTEPSCRLPLCVLQARSTMWIILPALSAPRYSALKTHITSTMGTSTVTSIIRHDSQQNAQVVIVQS